ncbi:MAG: sensor histidine kinase [Ramlibacter sp.]|jgi:signal transduction histidine kinase|uniref:sensor histidine kinase n=1 Tax=Ramlibacter sp. TaxID=1917967 RepID=UPI00261C1EBC|nr:histidine kinase [Ramlibacter sp.]MDB5751502.1 sensor histidine kinase [Ramlibacter sp.]
MKIDGIAKLQHLLQTLAFCLAVAALQIAFSPEKPYLPTLVYSLLIGSITWAVVDLGRHALPSAAETGWPQGLGGVLLIVAGILAGYFFGMAAGDRIGLAYGWYTGEPSPSQWRASLLITVLAGLAATSWFYARNKGAYLQRKMGEAQHHANEARLKLLEAQLEPHMLFNTLANLRVLIALDPQRAQRMLDHMIAYLRATLDGSRATSHSLEREFERLRDYLELMSIRMGPRLAYVLELPPQLAQQRVPTLLLQPLVENSIQHGLEPKLEGGRIAVSARREGGQLVLEVVDTGIGHAAPPADGKGFGLAQVRDRLATLHGAGASLELAPAGEAGMRAVIRMPVQS